MLVYFAPGEGYPLDFPVNYSSSSFSSSVSTTDEICLELGFSHYSHLYTSNVVHESPLAPQLQVDPVQVLWTYSCRLVAVEQIWEQYLHSHSSTGICAHLTCSVAHSVVGGSFNLWRTLLIRNLYLKSRSGSTASPKYRRNNKDRKFIQSSSIHAQLQLLRISSSVSQLFHQTQNWFFAFGKWVGDTITARQCMCRQQIIAFVSQFCCCGILQYINDFTTESFHWHLCLRFALPNEKY